MLSMQVPHGMDSDKAGLWPTLVGSVIQVFDSQGPQKDPGHEPSGSQPLQGIAWGFYTSETQGSNAFQGPQDHRSL